MLSIMIVIRSISLELQTTPTLVLPGVDDAQLKAQFSCEAENRHGRRRREFQIRESGEYTHVMCVYRHVHYRVHAHVHVPYMYKLFLQALPPGVRMSPSLVLHVAVRSYFGRMVRCSFTPVFCCPV